MRTAPVPTPEFTRDNNKLRHLTMDKTIFAALCDEAVMAAGVDLLFHAMPAAVTAWRKASSVTSPAANTPGTLVAVEYGATQR